MLDFTNSVSAIASSKERQRHYIKALSELRY